MAPNRITTTIYEGQVSAFHRWQFRVCSRTTGSAQPGSFHAGLLFHRGESATVDTLLPYESMEKLLEKRSRVISGAVLSDQDPEGRHSSTGYLASWLTGVYTSIKVSRDQ